MQVSLCDSVWKAVGWWEKKTSYLLVIQFLSETYLDIISKDIRFPFMVLSQYLGFMKAKLFL